jgi:hypothetical protein
MGYWIACSVIVHVFVIIGIISQKGVVDDEPDGSITLLPSRRNGERTTAHVCVLVFSTNLGLRQFSLISDTTDCPSCTAYTHCCGKVQLSTHDPILDS